MNGRYSVKILVLILAPAFLSSPTVIHGQGRVFPGAKVFIVPNQGFQNELSAAFLKKHTPVTVMANESGAAYRIETSFTSKKGSTARAIFTHVSGAETTASMRVVDVKTGDVVFAYSVRKGERTNQQSDAEACAKHLKQFVESASRNSPPSD